MWEGVYHKLTGGNARKQGVRGKEVKRFITCPPLSLVFFPLSCSIPFSTRYNTRYLPTFSSFPLFVVFCSSSNSLSSVLLFHFVPILYFVLLNAGYYLPFFSYSSIPLSLVHYLLSVSSFFIHYSLLYIFHNLTISTLYILHFNFLAAVYPFTFFSSTSFIYILCLHFLFSLLI